MTPDGQIWLQHLYEPFQLVNYIHQKPRKHKQFTCHVQVIKVTHNSLSTMVQFDHQEINTANPYHSQELKFFKKPANGGTATCKS